MDTGFSKKEIVEDIRAAVQLIKESGSPDATIAFPARAAAVARLLVLIRKLNKETKEN